MTTMATSEFDPNDIVFPFVERLANVLYPVSKSFVYLKDAKKFVKGHKAANMSRDYGDSDDGSTKTTKLPKTAVIASLAAVCPEMVVFLTDSPDPSSVYMRHIIDAELGEYSPSEMFHVPNCPSYSCLPSYKNGSYVLRVPHSMDGDWEAHQRIVKALTYLGIDLTPGLRLRRPGEAARVRE